MVSDDEIPATPVKERETRARSSVETMEAKERSPGSQNHERPHLNPNKQATEWGHCYRHQRRIQSKGTLGGGGGGAGTIEITPKIGKFFIRAEG